MDDSELPEGFFRFPVKERFDPRFGRWMTQEEWERAVEELKAGKRELRRGSGVSARSIPVVLTSTLRPR